MSARLNILMIHQGAELYGSDRSFVSAVCALRGRYPDATIDIVLPEPGPIIDLLLPYSTQIMFDGRGILRKIEFKVHPWRTLKSMVTAWLEYRRLVRSYDICYVNTVVCVAAIAALRGRRGGAYVHVREIPSALACRVFKAMLRFSRASLIYNSHATAAAFNLPGSVIHNGVDVFSTSATATSRRGRALRLAIIGRINPWKGQQFVLDALRTRGRELSVEVRVVGDVFAGYEDLLVKLQETANACAQHVAIEGFTNDPAAHYAWADFILVPSILPEPFGRVAIESFAAGRPVIASATGGLTEIVTDEVTGFLFKPNDAEDFVCAVERALSMTGVAYQRMAAAARQRYIRSFTVDTYMCAIAEVVCPQVSAAQRLPVTALRREIR
ncbi:putative Glycosyltransferase [Paraburkholderia piptadeniae]|uniref:Glycosyltransferase n=1 Tax=Paraburkholderia piptadeniae TaxID=1701573 RepID=A0A1N7SKU3_9BURK|nr:glycosyltransferase family 4 protein [Paraburkholderia piptadeniae]SIT48033.1 putative Glycosyltransferase [Paraburkholderia piptadeniae]